MSPSQYKLLLVAHITVSVGWFGAAFAKLVLGLVAVTTNDSAVADALYVSMDVGNVTFPPMAIATVVTGVLLSLGTRWGLLQHYWVATKLVLTVAVIVTAVRLGPAPSSSDPALQIALGVAHLLMLGVATGVSVYKPWGTTWFARRKTAPQSQGSARAA